MCYVTATELKRNLSYYLKKSETENVYVTKNKKVITVLTKPDLIKYLEVKEYVDKLEVPEPPRNENGNIKSDKELIGEEILEKCGF